ncbi:MAG: recombinase family protein [Mesorhizobium sp.]|uniref:recombinase family protein n=1 Tax=Mesorhizobium sp. TaxID=1871066 RepID=UPI001215B1BD|nr:recombinase family protein [Mesorhizobium sp.]TIP26252.1 MAG: recombinase family protein [Mesorhizobium sp.]
MTKHTVPATLTNRPKAFSYVRFSTPEQAKGDSFRRQTEAAAQYAAVNGLDMDTKFTFHDLGKSAFRGRNSTEGMLGEFLKYVKSGDVPKGSYLLVENLDRVSRETAWDALDRLRDIAKEGVTVVTLSDGKQYSFDSLRQNPMDMMFAIMLFMRANDESETKGRRVGAAWANKRRLAKDKPLTALCPGWLALRPDRSGFDPIPDRAATVRRVFELTLAGSGQHSIAETLNREGVAMFGRGKHWHRSYIKKMLADPSTIGTFTPHRLETIEGKKTRVPAETVEGYFPAVIDPETFERVAAMGGGRAGHSGRGVMANILAGLAKCPQCDATMTRVNKGGKKGGKPYLVCTVAKAGAGCDYRQVRLEDVTTTIIEKAGSLLGMLPSPEAELQGRWESTTAAEAAASDAIEKIIAAIEQTGHSPALLDRLRERSADREELKRTLADLEGRIADTLTNRVQETLGRLVDATEADGERDVAAINASLKQLFDKVVIDYLQGFLWLHWKHAPGEVSSLMYAWPRTSTE